MSFFQGASNIKISGGSFHVVHGNLNQFDQSRHQVNNDSFNTSTRTMIGSGNNSSRQYNGNNHYQDDDPPRSARSSRNDPSDYYPNDPNAYGPASPPTQRLQPYYPPNNRVEDSYNTNNETYDNVFNNNSKQYGAPPRNRRPQKPQFPGPQGFWEDDDDEAFWDSSSSRAQKNAGSSSRYGPDTYGQYSRNQDPAQQGIPPSTRRGPPRPPMPMGGVHSDIIGGSVDYMSPEMKKNFKKLMKTVAKETAPDPEDAVMEEEEEEEEEWRSDDEEDDNDSIREPEPKRQTGGLSGGMANLSLTDTAREAATSRTKSAPPLRDDDETLRDTPLTSAQRQAAPSWRSPPATETTPSISDTDSNASTDARSVPPLPGAGSYQSGAWTQGGGHPGYYGHPPPPNPADPNPYWAQHPSPPNQYGQYGGPGYNMYGGGSNVESIRSGNTRNVVVKDSYNDNSVQSYEPDAAASRPRKQGPYRRTAQG